MQDGTETSAHPNSQPQPQKQRPTARPTSPGRPSTIRGPEKVECEEGSDDADRDGGERTATAD
eukprot:2186853-Alexandrium_andersonii.AAC.1